VDTDKFKSNTENRFSAREKINIGRNELVIGNVGNLSPMKNHIDFIHAAGF
jgi:glycosyltransferase involved in cell wall biosynthesis